MGESREDPFLQLVENVQACGETDDNHGRVPRLRIVQQRVSARGGKGARPTTTCGRGCDREKREERMRMAAARGGLCGVI